LASALRDVTRVCTARLNRADLAPLAERHHWRVSEILVRKLQQRRTGLWL